MSPEIEDAVDEVMAEIDAHDLAGTSASRATTLAFLRAIKSGIDARINGIKADRASDEEDDEDDED